MTIKKKNKVLWTVVCLVGILAVGFGVRAYTSQAPATTVIENAGGVTINNPVQPVQEAPLGAMASPVSTYDYECINNDCTYHMTGNFQDATTTIVAFSLPFTRATTTPADIVLKNTTNTGYGLTAATSTIDNVRLQVTTAATSTWAVECGVAASNGSNGASTPIIKIIDVADNGIATSTVGVIANGLTTALGGLGSDANDYEIIAGGSQYPYFTCTIISLYTGAFTEATNTFDGTFSADVHMTLDAN